MAFNYNAAKQAGFTDAQINAYLNLYPSTPEKTIGGLLRNVPKSAVKTVGGITNAFLDPIQTTKNIGEIIKNPSVLKDYFIDRYGSLEKAKNSFYNYPIGVALDISTIAGGTGALLKGVGSASKISGLGRVGNVFSKVARITDPFALAGKGVRKVVPKNIFKGVGKGIEDVSKEFSIKATRASKEQITKMEEITGKPFEEFLSEYNLQGGAKANLPQLEKIINPLQKKYNSLVRTGKVVDIKDYIQEINKKIREIRRSDFTLEAEKVAQNLEKQRDFFISKAKTGKIPIDILTETKSSQFGRVPKGAMIDPTAFNTNKIIGGIGVQSLERLAPGSAELGKKLQALREYQEIAKSQSNLGLGTQVASILRPGYAGALPGYLIGSAFGNPLVGAGVGVAGAMALSNPNVISAVSKTGQAIGRTLQTGAKLPKLPIRNLYNVGKAGRLINNAGSPQNQKTTTNLPQLKSSFQSNPYKNPTPIQTKSQFVPKVNIPKSINYNPYKKTAVRKGSFY